MIVGHEKIQNFLEKSIKKNAVSQAYIFSGPESVGKFSLALEFAQKLTGSNAKINSDIIIMKPDAIDKRGITKIEDIKMEKIRDLQHQLSMTSHAGKCKVAIIDDADRMNKSAQNAMLKTLEEPMENVVLILVTDNLDKLLPTIISRCMNKKFSLASNQELEKIIPQNIKDREKIIFWSLGRPGLAKKLSENRKELEDRIGIEKELVELFGANVSEKLSLAEKISKDTGKLIETLNLWIVFLRHSLFENKKTILVSGDKIIQLIDKIEKSIEIIRETNSNTRLVLENLLLEF
jgi:DNA polymerase III subunit delta'